MLNMEIEESVLPDLAEVLQYLLVNEKESFINFVNEGNDPKLHILTPTLRVMSSLRVQLARGATH